MLPYPAEMKEVYLMRNDPHLSEIEKIEARIVGEMIRSTGIRGLIFSVGSYLVEGWADGSPMRERLARPVQWAITKASKTLPPKREHGFLSSEIGKLVTAWSRKVNREHAADPAAHSRANGRAIKGFIENTDFGEVADMVEGSEECAVKTVEALNEALWKYPAKVASILAALLAGINTSLRASREVIRPLENNVAPDLLADMILSLVNGIKGREAGELANSALELLRRLHTGSLLLGRAGKPLFQIYLTDLLGKSAPEIKPELLKKARIALAEDREAFSGALADALTDNPALVLAYVSSLGLVKSSSVKAASRRLKVLEDIDRADLDSAALEASRDMDTFEAAELVNTFFRVINRLHEGNPDIFADVARSIADSLDASEVRQTLEWLVPEVLDAFMPLIAEALPVIMKGLGRDAGGAPGSAGRETAFNEPRAATGAAGGEA